MRELPADCGEAMLAQATRLYPLCRSLTGEGVRETLAAVAQRLPLTIHEYRSGTPVFDWIVPPEWNLREAWIRDPAGRKIVDFASHSLHVVNYSEAVHERLSLAQLQPHLHSLPEHPDWIPYRTSYYDRAWGFCLSHAQREALADGEYEVFIDASHDEAGSLSVGEVLVAGQSDAEVWVYTHTCHPSLANDNLSGIAVCTELARWLLDGEPPRLSYRFLFGPGTIGSLSWMAHNPAALGRARLALVAVLLGDRGPLRYKRSEPGDALIDQAAAQLLEEMADAGTVVPFEPYGYEERQFNAPGIAIPAGRLSRSANGGYPEYHTSADNLDLIDADQLQRSLEACAGLLCRVDDSGALTNLSPGGEPQLGRRGLYGSVGGEKVGDWQLAMLWVLNQADGRRSMLDVAARSGLSYREISAATERLLEAGLVARGTHPMADPPAT